MKKLIGYMVKLEEVTGHVFSVTVGTDFSTGTIKNIISGSELPFETIQQAEDLVKKLILEAQK